MTAPLGFGRLHVLPAATAFLEAYPEADLRLVLSDRNLGLADEHLNALLRFGALPDNGLRAALVRDVRRIAVANTALLRSHATPRVPMDLATLPCIASEGIAADRSRAFSGPDGKAPGANSGRSAHNSPWTPSRRRSTRRWPASASPGPQYQCAAGLAGGALVRVLRDFEPEHVPVHLLHAGDGPLPLKLRTFLDHSGPR